MKAILITGGAGFIGSNFIEYMTSKYEDYQIINVDLLTYAGNLESLKSVEKLKNYKLYKGDIRDRSLMEGLFKQYKFDYVINFAAESHVDRSIEEPDVFVSTNILGTQVLLEVAKNHWRIGTDDEGYPTYREGVRYHQVSTDEVYGSLGKEGLFTETTNLSPNSPYSSSKASADLIVGAYYKTFKLPISITRCSNNYGPYQFPEKLIPLMINNALGDKTLPVYGDGMQIRDWLHVHDHCSAIDTVIHTGAVGQVYNVGGNNEKANIEIVKLIIKELGKTEELITYVKDRLGHDRRYAIDNHKITSELGWAPKYTFEEGMKETIRWYLDNQEWMKSVTSGDYQNYYEKMYGKK